MATVTSILSNDLVSNSRNTINTNFDNLNKQIYITYKSSVQGNNTTTLVADDHLKFSIGANEIWQFNFGIQLNGSAVADSKFQVVAPSVIGGGYNILGAGQTQLDGEAINGFATTSAQISLLDGSINFWNINGFILNGSQNGSVAVAWAQQTSTPSSVLSALPGSYLIAHKLN